MFEDEAFTIAHEFGGRDACGMNTNVSIVFDGTILIYVKEESGCTALMPLHCFILTRPDLTGGDL